MTPAPKKICCRICGGTEATDWLHPREMMFGLREIFDYFRCAGCGCLQLDAVPADLGRHYPDNYYSYGNMLDEPPSLWLASKRKWFRPAMLKHQLGWGGLMGRLLCVFKNGPEFPAWLRFLERPVPLNSRVLDVGCGSGRNLLELRDCGFTNLLGADPFIKESVTYPGDVQVRKCRLEEVEGKFSLITFHHVFEHLENPVATLQQARQKLTADGQIMIRIPLSDSLAAEKYQENWVDLDAPRHITLQTRRSMEVLAQKAGMKIVRVSYDSTEFQFLGSEQYLMNIPLVDPRSFFPEAKNNVFTAEQVTKFAAESAQLNAEQQGDQAAFVLVADQ